MQYDTQNATYIAQTNATAHNHMQLISTKHVCKNISPDAPRIIWKSACMLHGHPRHLSRHHDPCMAERLGSVTNHTNLNVRNRYRATEAFGTLSSYLTTQHQGPWLPTSWAPWLLTTQALWLLYPQDPLLQSGRGWQNTERLNEHDRTSSTPSYHSPTMAEWAAINNRRLSHHKGDNSRQYAMNDDMIYI